MPRGMGMLQSCGMPLAPGGACNQVRGTAVKLGCCWQCWGGRNIWEQLAVGWVSPGPAPWLACPTPGAVLHWWAQGLGGFAGCQLVVAAAEVCGKAVTRAL